MEPEEASKVHLKKVVKEGHLPKISHHFESVEEEDEYGSSIDENIHGDEVDQYDYVYGNEQEDEEELDIELEYQDVIRDYE